MTISTSAELILQIVSELFTLQLPGSQDTVDTGVLEEVVGGHVMRAHQTFLSDDVAWGFFRPNQDVDFDALVGFGQQNVAQGSVVDV